MEQYDTEIGDGTTAKLSVTCNADGSGWEHVGPDGMDVIVTAVECVYPPGEWRFECVHIEIQLIRIYI